MSGQLTSSFSCIPPAKLESLIECDSSLFAGGAYSKVAYITETYSQWYLACALDINNLEAINLVVALHTFIPTDPHNYSIRINTDNQASQTLLNIGIDKDPILCACARELWLFGTINSCTIEIVHKPGKDLILADALSRRPLTRPWPQEPT